MFLSAIKKFKASKDSFNIRLDVDDGTGDVRSLRVDNSLCESVLQVSLKEYRAQEKAAKISKEEKSALKHYYCERFQKFGGVCIISYDSRSPDAANDVEKSYSSGFDSSTPDAQSYLQLVIMQCC
jgi:hypothetical protein